MATIPMTPERLASHQSPVSLLDAAGRAVPGEDLGMPDDDVLLALYRMMVLGRRFDTQATALTKQGRLAVYPSARGQEACQIGAVLALRPQDWLFPTYRDSMAVTARGVDPVQVLTLLRGDWHSGYDPYQHRVAPQCTPLATNTLHAVGLARAATIKGEDTVALVMLGDGATSEGDTHAALNFAAVWKSPVVFLIRYKARRTSSPGRPGPSPGTARPAGSSSVIGFAGGRSRSSVEGIVTTCAPQR